MVFLLFDIFDIADCSYCIYRLVSSESIDIGYIGW